MSASELDQLDEGAWSSVAAAVRRLESAWRINPNPDLAQFLPRDAGPHAPLVLVELIKVDQEFRLRRGELRPVEEYVDAFQVLRGNAIALTELLEAECLTRALGGDRPSRAELRRRFPDMESQVKLEAILAQSDRELGLIAARDTAVFQPELDSTSPIATEILEPPQSPDELGRLAQYRILRILGEGGMGIVFQAEDQRLGRPVAVKTLRRSLAASPEFRQRFLREARAAAKLDHDHIVTIYQVDEAAGVPFLVMPLLQGETLEDRLRRDTTLPIALALRVGLEVADALCAAHEAGLIHRDVKPGNIWLEAKTNRVKLFDFGLAHFEGNQPGGATNGTIEPPGMHAHGLTQPGEQMGTLGYMAPELLLDRQADARSDLFALGCVLYRALTGVLPSSGGNVIDGDVAGSEPSRRLSHGCPPAFRAVVLSLVAPHPDDRPVSSRDVLMELTRIRGALDRRRRNSRWLAIAASALLVILLVAVVTANRWRRDPSNLRFTMARQYAVGDHPFDVVSADFDQDGILDLGVSNLRSHCVSILLGRGDGTFGDAMETSTGPEPHTIAVGDYDRDECLDIAVVTAQNNSIDVLMGDGDGHFELGTRLEVGAQPRGLASADLDNDGYLDLISSNNGSSDVTVWYGLGGGRFDSRFDHPVQTASPSVVAGDLNSDGKLDLVAANGGDDTISVLLAVGNRSFSPARHYVVGSGPGMLAIADFNGDQRLDVAVENFGSNDVTVLAGIGDGTFRNAGSFGVGSGPGGIEVGHFNGDELPDLIVANHLSNSISLLAGDRFSLFSPASHERVGDTPVGIAVGDFDGDDRLDFAVANHHSRNVSVVLNPLPQPTFRVSLPLNLELGFHQSFVVSAVDAKGAPLTTFLGRVRFTSDDPQAMLPAEYDFQPSDQGSHVFAARFGTLGPHTLEVNCDSPKRAGGSLVMIVPRTRTQ